MIATPSSPLTSSELEYLLLDDLYEALEEPVDWDPSDYDVPEQVIAIIDFLLALGERGISRDQDVVSKDEAAFRRRHEFLYSRLADLRRELACHQCSRSTIEAVRDSVLIWIHRVQRQRREVHQARQGRRDPRAALEARFPLTYQRQSHFPNQE